MPRADTARAAWHWRLNADEPDAPGQPFSLFGGHQDHASIVIDAVAAVLASGFAPQRVHDAITAVSSSAPHLTSADVELVSALDALGARHAHHAESPAALPHQPPTAR